MRTLKFLALAQNELDDVFEALEYQKEDQGYAFIAEIEKMLGYIKSYPKAYPDNTEHTQKCLLRNFPYAIIYQYRNDEITIVSIMNLRKKPIHWASKSVSEYATCRISILPETMYTR